MRLLTRSQSCASPRARSHCTDASVPGTIPGVSPAGGCAEGPWINYSMNCAPRCAEHYGPSETELICNGAPASVCLLSDRCPAPHTRLSSDPSPPLPLLLPLLQARGWWHQASRPTTRPRPPRRSASSWRGRSESAPSAQRCASSPCSIAAQFPMRQASRTASAARLPHTGKM